MPSVEGSRLLVWEVPGNEVAEPRQRVVGKGKRKRVIEDSIIKVYGPYVTHIHADAYRRAREVQVPPQAVKMKTIKWRIA